MIKAAWRYITNETYSFGNNGSQFYIRASILGYAIVAIVAAILIF